MHACRAFPWRGRSARISLAEDKDPWVYLRVVVAMDIAHWMYESGHSLFHRRICENDTLRHHGYTDYADPVGLKRLCHTSFFWYICLVKCKMKRKRSELVFLDLTRLVCDRQSAQSLNMRRICRREHSGQVVFVNDGLDLWVS